MSLSGWKAFWLAVVVSVAITILAAPYLLISTPPRWMAMGVLFILPTYFVLIFCVVWPPLAFASLLLTAGGVPPKIAIGIAAALVSIAGIRVSIPILRVTWAEILEARKQGQRPTFADIQFEDPWEPIKRKIEREGPLSLHDPLTRDELIAMHDYLAYNNVSPTMKVAMARRYVHSEGLLEELSQSPDCEPVLYDDALQLQREGRDDDAIALLAIVARANPPDDLLTRMYDDSLEFRREGKDREATALIAFVSRSHPPRELLAKMISSDEPMYRVTAFQDPNLPRELKIRFLEQIEDSNDSNDWILLAGDPDTPPEVLDRISRQVHGNPPNCILEKLIHNPKTPTNDLRRFAGPEWEGYPDVQQKAIQAIRDRRNGTYKSAMSGCP